jgi:phytoene dehydrogenase-like protein
MPTNSYDLIVVGDDFAGLIAGTLCARRGMRVLVLSQGGSAGAYSLGPHRLPVEPLCLAGLGSPLVQRVLDELQLGHALRRKLIQRPVSFQIVAPDVRLDVGADEHNLAAELARELPDTMNSTMNSTMTARPRGADAVSADATGAAATDAVSADAAAADAAGADAADARSARVDALAACAGSAAVAQHFDAAMSVEGPFPPTGFWKRREVDKGAVRLAEEAASWAAGFEAHPVVRAMIALPAVLGTHAPASELGAAAEARAFHLWRTGAPRLAGDWDALRELFLERLTKASGETRAARAEALTYSWGRVNGVRLESGEELGAGYVIAALPVAELVPLVGRKVPKRLSQCAEAVQVAGHRYTWNLVVDQAGVPEGMSSPLLLVGDPAAPLTDDNAVGIFLDDPDEEGHVTVTISAVCPPLAEGQSMPQALAGLRQRLRSRIDMVMPFLDEHVVVSHSPHDALPPEGIHASAARGMPLEPAPLWSAPTEAALGVAAVPYDIGLKHLAVASSQVLPRLGLEGSFAAGWSAALLASDAAGKKREYREVLASSG